MSIYRQQLKSSHKANQLSRQYHHSMFAMIADDVVPLVSYLLSDPTYRQDIEEEDDEVGNFIGTKP